MSHIRPKTIVVVRNRAPKRPSLHAPVLDGASAFGLVHLAMNTIGEATIERLASFLAEAKEPVSRYAVARCVREMVITRQAVMILRGNIATYRLR